MAPAQKVLLPLMAALPQASAWGNLGHTTVAYIAQNFVSDKTAKYAQNLLGDTSSNYLASVATWADTYRSTKEGAFSAVLHYLDALDNPPQSCNVNYERDCPAEGCIISALSNYSSRAVDQGVGTVEMQKALKWVVHFVGDVHQPLHVENILVGGNKISVTYNGAQTNLHAAWDTAIPEAAEGKFSLANSLKWATNLTAAIKTGAYKAESASWLQGINVKDAVDSTMIWAADTNSFVCSTVMPNGPDALTNQELSGAYYQSAIPVVQKQIAKAGYRLAAWLDAIVAASEQTSAEDIAYPADSSPAKAIRGPPYAKREFKLEPWMEEARAARREFGPDCGCGEEDHAH